MEKFLGIPNKIWTILIRAALFFISAIIIVLILPKEGKFKYEYQKGKPWGHESLIAAFDFPIYKTVDEIQLEKDSLLKDYKPYFKLDENIYTNQISLFKASFDEKWNDYVTKYFRTSVGNKSDTANKKLKENYLKFCNDILEYVYKKGVIKVPDSFDNKDNEGFQFVIVNNNIAEEFDLMEVFTLKSAKKYVSENSLYSNYFKADTAFIHSLDFNKYLKPNIYYDPATSKIIKENFVNGISLTMGMVQEGELIISKGTIISDSKFKIIESFRLESENMYGSSKSFYLILLGQIMLISMCLFVLFLFMFNFRKDILGQNKRILFILLMIVMFEVITNLVIKFDLFNIYLIPFALLPIIIRTFYDTRQALFVHLVSMLMIGFVVPNGYEFVFMQIIVGIIAIFSLANMNRRGQLFRASFFIFLAYSSIYIALSVTQEGQIAKIEWRNLIWFALNALLLLSAYPLIYVFERTFGYLSDITLMELSDTNHPLLRKLAERAPGTFHHSVQVAGLAEEVVFKIGGNPQLVRAGALYHDIGKINIPQYFIENLAFANNPHDKLEFDQSAEIIISHVTGGVELAKKYNIPEQIIDFIRMHHGTGRVQYFYRSFLNRYPNKEIEIEKFTYPGPNPNTIETAVLMMADCVEAACRSLKEHSDTSISDLVENVINNQLKEGLFDNVKLTFKDLATAKKIFKKKLKNIYHTRVEYPEVIT